MDAKAALKERTELYDNVFNFKHNPRVPVSGNFWTYRYFDAGYKLDEVLYDYDKIEKIVEEFHKRYNYDAYMETGTRNPLRVARAVGGGFHRITGNGEILEVVDHSLMEGDEYREYIDDTNKFYWTKFFKRNCKPGITLGELQNAVKELQAFQAFSARIKKKHIEDWGVMLCTNLAGSMGPPLESFFNHLRGIKECSLDLRRRKSELKEAMDYAFKRNVEPVMERQRNLPRAEGYATDINVGFLAHSILSVQQFEELYWPYFKKTLDYAIATNKRIFIFCESTMIRFAEFFQDIPKGVVMAHLEQDDIFEIRKKIPNMALAGGMTTAVLGNGTKQECIDYAKKLIDTLGEGFVLSQDKMMSFKNDAKRENLLAVNEFVRNYQY